MKIARRPAPTVDHTSPVTLIGIAALVLLSAGVGVWLGGVPRLSLGIVPAGGGVLVGIALFWVLPELIEAFGPLGGGAWGLAGFAFLWAVNRFLYPVCPACSHTHDHHACTTRLHGFATPLILAAGLHSLFDGLGLAAGHEHAAGELGRAVFWGIALHKIPEGIALGVILRAALKTWKGAVLGAMATQAPMLAGGLIEHLVSAHLTYRSLAALLALAGGGFAFLGFHAVHGEWRRRGGGAPLLLALAGAAAVALFRHSV